MVTCNLWKEVDGIKAGVLTGDVAWNLIKHAKKHGYAMPAFNVTSSSNANCVLEAAKKINSPVMIQVSQGGAQFFAGKSLSNEGQAASILGAVSCALHVRNVAPSYGVPVILHSDHCAKKLLPWLDGMITEDEKYFAQHGEPLFSSHMIDLSESTVYGQPSTVLGVPQTSTTQGLPAL